MSTGPDTSQPANLLLHGTQGTVPEGVIIWKGINNSRLMLI
jgi:hypothetical protein